MKKKNQGGSSATFFRKIISLIFVFFFVFTISSCYQQKPFQIDPFESCQINYEGWNKKATPIVLNEIEYNGNNEAILKFLDSMEYKVTPNKNVQNGDIITVKLVYSKEKKELANIEFTEEEKKFTVHGLVDEKRKMKNEFIRHETDEGIPYEELKQTLIVNDVEIPVSWHLTEEEIQAYVKYVKGLESKEEVENVTPVNDWIQGESKKETHRKTSKFLCEDYLNNAITTYKDAYKYGIESSQEFKIEPLMKDGATIGYTCRFKE